MHLDQAEIKHIMERIKGDCWVLVVLVYQLIE